MTGTFTVKFMTVKVMPLHKHGVGKYCVTLGDWGSLTGTRQEIEELAKQLLAGLPAVDPEIKEAA